MPSHRADTPTDAATTVRTRPSGHPPQQRRRDLRAHNRTTSAQYRPAPPAAGLSWPDEGETNRSARGARLATPARGTLAERAAARAALRTPHRGNPLGIPQVDPSEPPETPTWGALALDPLFNAGSGRLPDDWVVTDPDAERADAERADAEPADAQPVDAREIDDLGVDGVDGVHGEPLLDQVWQTAAPTTGPATGPRPRTSAGRRVATRSALQRAQLRLAPEPSPARRGGTFSVPQVGIAGALGLATIAVPLTGAFALAPAAKETSATVAAAAAALEPLPPFPLASPPPLTALDDARLLPDEEPEASVPARLAAPRVLLVGGPVSRGNERSVLPGCNGQVPDVNGVQNGQLPASMLCTLWDPKRQLRSDAAVAIAKLNIAYQQHFGHPMCFTDAYRSLDAQFKVKAERGGFAARPGTSEHGWGLAVDLCDGVEAGASSPTYQWLRENASFYGWQNPTWAQPGGAGPFEPWHWEYFPGEKKGSSSGD